MIGDVYKLKQYMMGNDEGSIGYVYDEYPDFNDPREKGVCVIFENGEYCGFSKDETDAFLELVGHEPLYEGYQFKSVIFLSMDYEEEYWKWPWKGN